jgi:ATP-dependent Zn protease
MTQGDPNSTPPFASYAYPQTQNVPPRGSKLGRGLFGWVLFIGLAVMLFVVLNNRSTAHNDISITEFRKAVMDGNIAEVSVQDDYIQGRFIKPMQTQRSATGIAQFRVDIPKGVGTDWRFLDWMMEHGITLRANNNSNLHSSVLIPLIPWLLIFCFIYIFIFRQLRKSSPQGQQPIPVIIVNPDTK